MSSFLVNKAHISTIADSHKFNIICGTVFAFLGIYMLVGYYFVSPTRAFTIPGGSCIVDSGGITANVVECINVFLAGAGRDYLAGIIGGIGRAVGMVCTLAIIFMGMRLVVGAVLMKQAMIFMLQLVAVATICVNPSILMEWRDALMFGVYRFGNLVMDASLGIVGDAGVESGAASCTSGSIFKRFDCQFVRFTGIDIANNEMDIGEVAGLVLFTGPLGVEISMLVFATVISFAFAMAQVVAMYIVFMFIVTVLFVIAPIIMPFMLFPATVDIFKKYVTAILGYTMMLPMLFANMAITIGVLDLLGSEIQATYTDIQDQIDAATLPRMTVFSMPTTVVAPEVVDDASEIRDAAAEILELNPETGEPMEREGWYKTLSSNVSGWYNDKKEQVVNAAKGWMLSTAMSFFMDISIPYYAFDEGAERVKAYQFILLLLVTIILVSLLAAWGRTLPLIVAEMIARQSVSDFSPGTKIVTDAKELMQSGAQTIAIQRDSVLRKK